MTKTVSRALLLMGVLMSAQAQDIEFRLPAGFSIDVLVDGVRDARSLALGDQGTLFVATQRAGVVYAVRGALSGTPEVTTIIEKLKMPNGVAFRSGSLYVAERHRVIRLDDIEERLHQVIEPEVVIDVLPYETPRHAWKYIAFGPDGQLYVPVGAPCNICDKADFALLLRMNPDGSNREVYARGIRNTVGFDWHPETGELWFTDNGRDLLGDDIPPCELNRVTEPGQHFGFPWCHGGTIPDPEFSSRACDEFVPPAQNLGPHVAPLGMKFYTGTMFPEAYRNQIFIAEHGSWNRSEQAGKTGYRVTLVRLDGSRVVGYEPFLEGFLDGDEVLGRPVDILVAPDGAMLVSDDHRGVIYRIAYTRN